MKISIISYRMFTAISVISILIGCSVDGELGKENDPLPACALGEKPSTDQCQISFIDHDVVEIKIEEDSENISNDPSDAPSPIAVLADEVVIESRISKQDLKLFGVTYSSHEDVFYAVSSELTDEAGDRHQIVEVIDLFGSSILGEMKIERSVYKFLRVGKKSVYQTRDRYRENPFVPGPEIFLVDNSGSSSKLNYSLSNQVLFIKEFTLKSLVYGDFNAMKVCEFSLSGGKGELCISNSSNDDIFKSRNYPPDYTATRESGFQYSYIQDLVSIKMTLT